MSISRTAALTLALLAVGAPLAAETPAAPQPIVKIWNPPAYKTLAQSVIDRMWAAHGKDLLGITFHAIPPGGSAYAMIAGTWPDRVGKASAEDDIMSAKEGFIILDPRYRKTDPEPKYLVIIPLKDVGQENIGAIVFGFRNPPASGKDGPKYTALAMAMRNEFSRQIPNAAALYSPAR